MAVKTTTNPWQQSRSVVHHWNQGQQINRSPEQRNSSLLKLRKMMHPACIVLQKLNRENISFAVRSACAGHTPSVLDFPTKMSILYATCIASNYYYERRTVSVCEHLVSIQLLTLNSFILILSLFALVTSSLSRLRASAIRITVMILCQTYALLKSFLFCMIDQY